MAALLTLFRHASRTEERVSDRDLLDRFAVGRDEPAFAELVRRHGPVVYRICRRLVGASAADDAFQATFLVLATRVDAARAAGSVGGWLVGVVGRVARQLRRAALRRAHYETVAAAQQRGEPDHTIDLADQFRVLDEELARLPDRLRDPVVLCLLQGRTQEEAARELGRDARTLRRRLERAKRVLRARLEGRGVVPAVATGLITAAGTVSAAVPGDLAHRTVSTVFDFLTGGARRLAPVVLAKGVATSMIARKLTHLMALAAAGLVGIGVVLADDARPTPAPAATPSAPLTAAVPPVVAPPPTIPLLSPTATRASISKPRPGEVPDERMIVIQALCIQAPSGICEKIGVAEEKDTATAWVLSHREARMLTALIRAEKDKGNIEVLSRPQITCSDNQSAFVQVGQDVPLITKVVSQEKDGATTTSTTIEKRPVGSILRVTPRGSPDGKFILLRVESQQTSVVPETLNIGNDTTAPAFNIQTVTTTLTLPDGGTAVTCAGTIRSEGGKKQDVIWVLTPQLLKAPPTIQPPAKRPPPALPPDAVPPAPVEPVTTIQPVPPPAPVVQPVLTPVTAPRRP